ncbi:ABC transporter permease [Brevibacillus daliensis]|uniref:ABC transporter permease n=1 Tax=Brevibacillus daliensis TaxID=2892995 RepID=UPI001E366139|nr:ABC transporter permease [Brevibacillus daliensis]
MNSNLNDLSLKKKRRQGRNQTFNPSKHNVLLWFILSLVLVLLLWELLCRLMNVPAFLLPPPSEIAKALWNLRTQLIGEHLPTTLQEAILGLAISIVLGSGLAIWMRISATVEKMIYPYLIMSQTIPVLALSPVFIMWFGYELPGKIAIVVLFTFFPILVGTYDGLKRTEQEMVELFQTMGANRRQIFTKLQLPSALPHFFSGVKVAATFSVSGATVGEWLGASEGLGYFGRRAAGNFQAPNLFATVVLLSLMGIIFFLIFRWLEKRFVYQEAREEKRK